MSDFSPLVGTWVMRSWKKEFEDTGEVVDAHGPDPMGFVTYSADGRVHAIVVRRNRAAPLTSPPSLEEKAALFDSMLAYSGTYTLHSDRVIHHLDASWNQSWTGSDQVRFFRLSGSSLEITGAPAPDPYTGRSVVHRITFEKWRQSA